MIFRFRTSVGVRVQVLALSHRDTDFSNKTSLSGVKLRAIAGSPRAHFELQRIDCVAPFSSRGTVNHRGSAAVWMAPGQCTR